MNEKPHRSCPKCGMEILSSVKICPYCGAKMRGLGKLFWFGFIGFLILFVTGGEGEAGLFYKFLVQISLYSMIIGFVKWLLWDFWHYDD